MAHLEIDSIELAHGPQVVFKDFSYDFNEGCFAIMGRNGVGKSTLLNALAGSNAPRKGRINIDGIDLYRNAALAKAKLCYVPDNAMFYPFASGREFLNFVLSIHNKTALLSARHTLDLITSLGLSPYLDTRFSDASLGTRVKLYLLVAFIIRPTLLIMDEPFNGLDRTSTASVIHFLNQHRNKCVVVLSTHNDAVVEALEAKCLVLDGKPNCTFKMGNLNGRHGSVTATEKDLYQSGAIRGCSEVA